MTTVLYDASAESVSDGGGSGAGSGAESPPNRAITTTWPSTGVSMRLTNVVDIVRPGASGAS